MSANDQPCSSNSLYNFIPPQEHLYSSPLLIDDVCLHGSQPNTTEESQLPAVFNSRQQRKRKFDEDFDRIEHLIESNIIDCKTNEKLWTHLIKDLKRSHLLEPTEKKREEQRIRKAKSRTDMSDCEGDYERELARNRMKNLRNAMTVEERNAVNEADRNRKLSRKDMSEKERNAQRISNLQSQKNHRQGKSGVHGSIYLKASSKNADFYKLGHFDLKCSHCPAVHFPEEMSTTKMNEFGNCCNYGQFANLEELIDEYPNDLKVLFDPEDAFHLEKNFHKDFVKNIRKLNSNFSCASLGCMRFRFPNKSIPIFKIQGAIYHSYNCIAYPEKEELPTNGQLYFIDTEEALNFRIDSFIDKANRDLNDKTIEIMAYIETYLRNNYVFAQSYKMMKEIMTELEEKSIDDGTEMPEVAMLFGVKKGTDLRKYNIPRSNEVCAIMFRNANEDIPAANIIVHSKGNKQMKRIYPLDKLVEPLVYPIFYPKNSHGWYCELKDRKGKNISLCDFTKYKLHFRNDGKFLPHHYGQKLFQQWVVDQCARIEWQRLNYIKLHQKEICKESYSEIEKMLESRAIEEGLFIKKQVILPSSFTGGPRNMHESFMDAMTIVNEVGRPDLFLTYTCNPKDEDIIKCLKTGQQVHDRPDIVARVFRLKVIQFLKETTGKDGIFGETSGFCYSIEFQKRGLPHLHLLITLKKEDKWHDTNDIDKFISSEIPDEKEDKELYELVKTLMIHGPCGKDIPGTVCWDETKKRCNKKYPKEFREKTDINENGYPYYKWPNNGRTCQKKIWSNGEIKLMTNRDIVPYNPYLLKRFRSHINVEKVADIKAVKYIYKYIYKGYDSASIRCVSTENGQLKELIYDEAGNYLDARYLSPVEAAWKILKFPLQAKSHTVIRLPVHLENEQMIYFNDDDDEDTIVAKRDKKSKLLAYFDYMTEHPEEQFTYPEMPKYCTWDSKNGKWNTRKKGFGKIIGRMYPVNPKDGEKYHLRYLLLNVHGKSFKDYKTVDNIEYESFGQSCLARGLTTDDEEWKMCMNEASNYKFPSALRNLFASILLYGNPKYPEQLWENFKDNMAEDFVKKYSPEISYKMTLSKINKHLLNEGKNLTNYTTLPQEMIENFDDDEIINPIEELKIVTDRYGFMNKEQKQIFDYVKNNSIIDKKQVLLYVDGPAGTGKSFELTSLFHFVRGHGKNMVNMAFSGRTATLLKHGRTLHNRFKFSLNINEQTLCGPLSTRDIEEIKNTDFFVIDEAPMAPRFIIEAIDKKLRELMNCTKLFGGKNIILAGDFRQTLPIKKFGTRSEVVDLIIKKSKLWKHFKVMKLTENMRATDKIFAKQILDIGDGTFGSDGFIELPKECIVSNNSNLLDEIYSETFDKRNYKELKDRIILSPYNDIVDNYNKEAIENFPGEYVTYLSSDETEISSNFTVTVEILNSFNCPGFPVHELKVKRNCKLIYLRNTSIKEGLCNGTMLQLIEASKNLLRCIILGGEHDQKEVYIHRITLISEKEFPVQMKRHQFPVRLAFAATFIKGQGETYQNLGIDWTRPSFTHGHSYVAISRVGAWNKVKAKLPKEYGW